MVAVFGKWSGLHHGGNAPVMPRGHKHVPVSGKRAATKCGKSRMRPKAGAIERSHTVNCLVATELPCVCTSVTIWACRAPQAGASVAVHRSATLHGLPLLLCTVAPARPAWLAMAVMD
jgi:hypothetical protein